MEKQKDYGINSLIDAVTKDLSEAVKQEYLSRGCKQFSEKCIAAMHNYSSTNELCENNCEYCKRFKFVIERAKHYAEILQIPLNDVLAAWENKRDYWWLNYYQEANQPLIKISGKLKVFDTYQQAMESFKDLGFRCPCCGGISHNPHECDSGVKIKDNGKTITCNWKSYGFLRCLGKGATVVIKEDCSINDIFMPIAWESESK